MENIALLTNFFFVMGFLWRLKTKNGIWIAIAKKIVELHEGTFTIVSTFGKRATVFTKLPENNFKTKLLNFNNK